MRFSKHLLFLLTLLLGTSLFPAVANAMEAASITAPVNTSDIAQSSDPHYPDLDNDSDCALCGLTVGRLTPSPQTRCGYTKDHFLFKQRATARGPPVVTP